MMVRWLLGFGIVLTSGLAAAAAPGPKFVAREGAPLSQSVRVGDVVYLSGLLGLSQTEPNGIEPETRRAMEAIGAALQKHGLTHDAVFKCTVYLADMAEWGAMNKVYVPYFKPGRLPTRSAVAVGLAGGARVEIECAAYAGKPG